MFVVYFAQVLRSDITARRSSDDDSSAKIKSSEVVEEDVTNDNSASVSNVVTGVSETGDNKVKSWDDDVEGASITSGEAVSATVVGNFVKKLISRVIR